MRGGSDDVECDAAEGPDEAPTDLEAVSVDELVLARATGVWEVRSAAPHELALFVDTDAPAVTRSLYGRDAGLFAGQWLVLRSVRGRRRGETDIIRSGERHLFDLYSAMDVELRGALSHGPVAAIVPASREQLVQLPLRLPRGLGGGEGGVEALAVDEATGVWVVRSSSPTIYVVDADAGALLRVPGAGSSPGVADDRWVPLVRVRGYKAGDEGIIRVADRHEYVFDHDRDGADFGWWLQRIVTRIDPATDAELAGFPTRVSGAWQ
ncbi:hypothetical protein [Cellulomonas biazotea]|uniref:Uncharacterized protein n=1 Tax=Cellulomonas biazotea TaxID=1709 RepID=A0A402DNE1_9CELL|nr:hypothetical protein [Cellulomonas biazotea]GCE75644.1 hypothetical protein CBZ_07000 [Cellulomonas biazotea]